MFYKDNKFGTDYLTMFIHYRDKDANKFPAEILETKTIKKLYSCDEKTIDELVAKELVLFNNTVQLDLRTLLVNSTEVCNFKESYTDEEKETYYKELFEC